MAEVLGFRKKSGVIALIAVIATVMVLAFSGCVTTADTIDVPFGASAESAGVTMSTAKTGEGEFRVIVSSTAAEELTLDIRVSYPEIGFDYGSGSGSGGYGGVNSNMMRAKFEMDSARQTIRFGEEQTVTVRLTNRNEVNRQFDFTIRVSVEGADMNRRFSVSVADTDLFTDVKYLRQLNKTDYWNPHIIGENWDKYLRHVEDL